jgi:Fic family protein
MIEDMAEAEIRFDLTVDDASPQLIRWLARIDALALAIASLPIPVALRESLNLLHIARAIRGTTGIEGIDVTEEEAERIVSADEAPALSATRAQTEREVRNAAAVMRDIAITLRRTPDAAVTEPLVARMHRLMTEGVAYPHNTPGVYRSHAVSVGAYVPPRSRGDVQRLMSDFVEWVKGRRARALHPIVRAVAAHYYLVSIHPFGDGNGRTSRAVESFLLYQARINVLGFYSLANFYYRNREGYIGALEEVQRLSRRDLTGFVEFAVGGLVEELEEIWSHVATEMKRISFMQHAHETLVMSGAYSAGAADRMYRLAAGLVEPVSLLAIRDGTHALGSLYRHLSAKTLARDVALLEELRLVIVQDRRVRANLDLMTDLAV